MPKAIDMVKWPIEPAPQNFRSSKREMRIRGKKGNEKITTKKRQN